MMGEPSTSIATAPIRNGNPIKSYRKSLLKYSLNLLIFYPLYPNYMINFIKINVNNQQVSRLLSICFNPRSHKGSDF